MSEEELQLHFTYEEKAGPSSCGGYTQVQVKHPMRNLNVLIFVDVACRDMVLDLKGLFPQVL